MHYRKTLLAVAAAALGGPSTTAIAQSTTTLEAEKMALSGYVVENGNRIKLSGSAAGTASQSFSGASGTYNVQIQVVAESDGQSTLELYRGTTLLKSFVYPKYDGNASFTLDNVALNSGETLRLIGRPNAGAIARVDKVVLTQVSAAAPAPSSGSASAVTMEAESMALSGYAVENGNRIKLTSSTAAGTATKSFAGGTGTYDIQIQAVAESDGQSTLELYRGSTLLKSFTYPKYDGNTTFSLANVALNAGDSIRVVGRPQAGAIARVDKIAFSPVGSSTPTTPDTSTPTSPVPSTPSDPAACANPSGGYEGFGKNTTGGAGKAIYKVTNRNDSGAGSLRDAVSQGNRCVVFDVGGTINLASNVLVKGANVTIDGLTAPSPGITLSGRALVMQGSSGASNVVVRGIRLRNTPSGEDAIRVYQSKNIVIDRVSVSGYGDGGIDVTQNSSDVTIQWSIVGGGGSNGFSNLIGYDTKRVTTHHNLYINGQYRHPYCGRNNGATSLSSEVVCDVRNNVVWNYSGHGTAVMDYGTANIVNNYYYTTKSSSASQTINLGYGGKPVSAYVSGNYSQNGWNLSGLGNRSTPYSAVTPGTTDARTAAKDVIAKAGARSAKFGLDSVDQGYLGQVKLP